MSGNARSIVVGQELEIPEVTFRHRAAAGDTEQRADIREQTWTDNAAASCKQEQPTPRRPRRFLYLQGRPTRGCHGKEQGTHHEHQLHPQHNRAVDTKGVRPPGAATLWLAVSRSPVWDWRPVWPKPRITRYHKHQAIQILAVIC